MASPLPQPLKPGWVPFPLHVDGSVLEPLAQRGLSPGGRARLLPAKLLSSHGRGGCCKEEIQPSPVSGGTRQPGLQPSGSPRWPLRTASLWSAGPMGELSAAPKWIPESLGFLCLGDGRAEECWLPSAGGAGHHTDPASGDLRAHLPAGHLPCHSTLQCPGDPEGDQATRSCIWSTHI